VVERPGEHDAVVRRVLLRIPLVARQQLVPHQPWQVATHDAVDVRPVALQPREEPRLLPRLAPQTAQCGDEVAERPRVRRDLLPFRAREFPARQTLHVANQVRRPLRRRDAQVDPFRGDAPAEVETPGPELRPRALAGEDRARSREDRGGEQEDESDAAHVVMSQGDHTQGIERRVYLFS
jgi:hypothetical protein